MKLIGWAVAVVFLCGVLVAACFAAGNDDDSFAPVRLQLVSHERERCYDGDCGDQDYDQWNSDQNNHNRRNRGAFSPGPFDRSPVEMHDVCISLDCSGRDKDRDRQDPGEARASLFPFPTPGGVQKFVIGTIEAGIGLGRLFANATIDFVSSIMVGVA